MIFPAKKPLHDQLVLAELKKTVVVNAGIADGMGSHTCRCQG